jgi:hypothetical protein
MYDMYPWDDRPATASPHAPAGAIKAVQIALDRRDNGGDGAAEVAVVGPPTAGPTRQ